MNFGRPDITLSTTLHHVYASAGRVKRPRWRESPWGRRACTSVGDWVSRWGIKGEPSNFSPRKAVVFNSKRLITEVVLIPFVARHYSCAGKMMDDELNLCWGSEGELWQSYLSWEWRVRVRQSWVPEGTRHWQIHPAHCISEALLFWILATHEWPSSLTLPACERCCTMPGDLSATNSYHSLSWQSQAQTIPACERARLKYLFLHIMAAQI